jgi:hypothetical protein
MVKWTKNLTGMYLTCRVFLELYLQLDLCNN